MHDARPDEAPDTDPRARPVQSRSASTVSLMLDTAAHLLEELGFERLSTNRICAVAGLTPPAIYRYFPNKYAVLKALGERLMASQNAALDAWVAGDAGRMDPCTMAADQP